jgi:acyl-CoA thioester hydrolase
VVAPESLPPHQTLIEVRFREVDSYGVAWHGHFVDWLEVARHRFAAHFGLDTRALLAQGFRLPVLELAIDYRQPLRFGDRVLVEVATAEDPRRVLALRYRLGRESDGGLVASARTVQVLQGPDDRLRLTWPAEIVRVCAAMRAYEAARAGAAAAGSETVKRVP